MGLVGQAVGCRESGFGWVHDFWLFGLLGYDVVVVGGGVVGEFVVVVFLKLYLWLFLVGLILNFFLGQ